MSRYSVRITSSLCSPSSGARRVTSGGVALNLIGEPQRPETAEHGVIGFDDHLARLHLRIGKHLRVVVDRTARNVAGIEQLEPVAARVPTVTVSIRAASLSRLAHAARVVGELGRRGPLRVTQRLAQPLKQPLVRRADA